MKYTVEVFLMVVGTYEGDMITSINYLNKDWDWLTYDFVIMPISKEKSVHDA